MEVLVNKADANVENIELNFHCVVGKVRVHKLNEADTRVDNNLENISDFGVSCICSDSYLAVLDTNRQQ